MSSSAAAIGPTAVRGSRWPADRTAVPAADR